jgi:hypothetical protein
MQWLHFFKVLHVIITLMPFGRKVGVTIICSKKFNHLINMNLQNIPKNVVSGNSCYIGMCCGGVHTNGC